jgi:hypothetical protein
MVEVSIDFTRSAQPSGSARDHLASVSAMVPLGWNDHEKAVPENDFAGAHEAGLAWRPVVTPVTLAATDSRLRATIEP